MLCGSILAEWMSIESSCSQNNDWAFFIFSPLSDDCEPNRRIVASAPRQCANTKDGYDEDDSGRGPSSWLAWTNHRRCERNYLHSR